MKIFFNPDLEKVPLKKFLTELELSEDDQAHLLDKTIQLYNVFLIDKVLERIPQHSRDTILTQIQSPDANTQSLEDTIKEIYDQQKTVDAPALNILSDAAKVDACGAVLISLKESMPDKQDVLNSFLENIAQFVADSLKIKE